MIIILWQKQSKLTNLCLTTCHHCWSRDFSTLNFDNIFGFILNVPNTSTGSLLSPLNYIPMQARIWSSQKHWIAIRKIENYYYNLDSKLTAPTCIGNNQSLVQFLSQNRSTEQIETFLVISKQVAKDKSWSKAETWITWSSCF